MTLTEVGERKCAECPRFVRQDDGTWENVTDAPTMVCDECEDAYCDSHSGSHDLCDNCWRRRNYCCRDCDGY